MAKRKRFSDYLYLVPASVLYITVIVVPAGYSLYLSLYKWNGIAPVKRFVGLRNYVQLFTGDGTFLRAMGNNVVWVLLTMTFTVGIGLVCATVLNRNMKGRTLFRGVFYFPYVLSGVIVAIIWTWVYHPQLGLLTNLAGALGLQGYVKPYLADPGTAFLAIYVAGLWHGFGAPMVLFLAGLQTIPKELYEAAKIDGSNALHSFHGITIPMLRETFVIVFATQIIGSVKVYDIVMAMTGGGPAHSTHTMATWMNRQSFFFANVGTGTAIACLMVIVLMIVIVPFVLYMARD